MSTRLDDICGVFERALGDGELVFGEVVFDDLPESTREYVDGFVVSAGIGVEVCSRVVDGCFLFRLNDPVLGYLFQDSVGGQHMWADVGFREGLNPQAAFWYLVCRKYSLGFYDEVEPGGE